MNTLSQKQAVRIGAAILAGLVSASAWAADVPSPIGGNSMSAASPMTDYTIAAVIYVLITGALIASFLIGGFLILNLGLMSKRDQDRVGGRDPSDVGVLKNSNWPQEAENRSVLPAADEGEDGTQLDSDQPKGHPGSSSRVA